MEVYITKAAKFLPNDPVDNESMEHNSGEVDNRGFDMTINWGDAFANGWSYNLTGIVGWSRNKVLKKKIADDHPSYRAILGQPMGSIYGFNALGTIPRPPVNVIIRI